MNRRIRTCLIITLCLIATCVYLIAGFPPGAANIKSRVHRGLDLQGGIRLELQVVTDDAIRSEADRAIESSRAVLQKKNIPFGRFLRKDVDAFVVQVVDKTKDAQLRKALEEALPDWRIDSAKYEGMDAYIVTLRSDRISALRDETVDQAIKIIRNRIDRLGVAEAVIQKQGGKGVYEILVQLPGVDDTERVKALIQATSVLEMKLIDSGPFSDEMAVRSNYGGAMPADLEILPLKQPGTNGPIYYVAQRTASVRGRELRSAYPSRDANGHPAVTFTLTAEGSQRFARLTEQNIGKHLAIVLDGKIQSAPAIHTRISDSAIIEGGPAGFSAEAAQDLSLTLRSGALPASMIYLSEEVVGPTLGSASIHAGVRATIIALTGVALFMLIYYRMSGVNALIAMMLNILILLAAVAYFGITLTLPGIAGITLTIGVGIDSNVLIFERIREELRAGKTAAAAVSTGFNRVFITLIDTHLAALISAAFLFLFGTGPVKGFAVTLVIGLVSNMFTAVFVSRTLFEWVLARQKSGAGLSI